MTPEEIRDLYNREDGDDCSPEIPAQEHRTEAGTRYLREAGVGLVSRPDTNLYGAYSFFEQMAPDTDYLDDEYLTGDAKLAKFAGQLCYLSLGKERTRNGDASRYFENIKRQSHGSVLEHANYSVLLYGVSRACCYDAETDVLTRRGWVSWPNIKEDDEFASMTQDGLLVYERASERYAGMYEGDLYEVRSEQIDLAVTSNHRMWVQIVDTQIARRNEAKFGIYSANSLLHRRVRYQKGGVKWVGNEAEIVKIPITKRTWTRPDNGAQCLRMYDGVTFPSEPFAKFLGYFLSEGWTDSDDTDICLAQNQGHVLDDMIKTLNALSVTFSIEKCVGIHRRLKFKNVALYDWLRKQCGHGAKNKHVPPEVMEWSPRLLSLMLDSLLAGDGNIHLNNGHRVLYTSSPELADDVQIIALKIGIAANIRIDDRVGKKHSLNGKMVGQTTPGYIVSFLMNSRLYPHINHNRKCAYPNRFRFDDNYNDRMRPFKGMVYCVKVPHGLLYVRRNGKPCWSGNTHELVRHRSGMAYSQVSQRYVAPRHVRFVEAHEYQSDYQAHCDFESWIDASVAEYERREQAALLREFPHRFEEGVCAQCGKEADAPGEGGRLHLYLPCEHRKVTTEDRKRVRQAARRCLPNETEAPILATGNIRAWRHIIEMRCSPHADVEIRRAFWRVFLVLAIAEPLLWEDYTARQLDDGTYALDTPYRKI